MINTQEKPANAVGSGKPIIWMCLINEQYEDLLYLFFRWAHTENYLSKPTRS